MAVDFGAQASEHELAAARERSRAAARPRRPEATREEQRRVDGPSLGGAELVSGPPAEQVEPAGRRDEPSGSIDEVDSDLFTGIDPRQTAEFGVGHELDRMYAPQQRRGPKDRQR